MTEKTVVTDFIHELADEFNLEQGDDGFVLNETIQADQLCKKLGYIEDKIESLEREQMRSSQFYQDRINKKAKRVAYIEALLLNYANNQEEKTIKLPFGTLSKRKSTKKLWPEDTVLIDFSKSNHIPIRIKEAPNKLEISKYITETGEMPEGYDEKETTSFSVKTNKLMRGE